MIYGQNILFDALKNILQLKSDELFQKHVALEDFEKQFPRYMVLRYLSMCGDASVQKFVCENQVAFERFPDNKSLYKLLLETVPKQKSGFIRYIK